MVIDSLCINTYVTFRCVQTRYPACKVIVYTGDTEAAPDQIIQKASQRSGRPFEEKKNDNAFFYSLCEITVDILINLKVFRVSYANFFP